MTIKPKPLVQTLTTILFFWHHQGPTNAVTKVQYAPQVCHCLPIPQFPNVCTFNHSHIHTFTKRLDGRPNWLPHCLFLLEISLSYDHNLPAPYIISLNHSPHILNPSPSFQHTLSCYLCPMWSRQPFSDLELNKIFSVVLWYLNNTKKDNWGGKMDINLNPKKECPSK